MPKRGSRKCGKLGAWFSEPPNKELGLAFRPFSAYRFQCPNNSQKRSPMNDIENLLEQLLSKMTDVASTLEEISGKLDNINGAYSLDDLALKLDSATDDIVGATRYNLTDVHGELCNITSELSDISLQLTLKG